MDHHDRGRAAGEPRRILKICGGIPVKAQMIPATYDLLQGRVSITELREVDIVFPGVRPGEKLFEELQYSSESIDKTRHPKIYIGKIAGVPSDGLALALARLRELAVGSSADDIRAFLGSFLPEAQLDGGNDAAPSAARRAPVCYLTSFVLAGRGRIRRGPSDGQDLSRPRSLGMADHFGDPDLRCRLSRLCVPRYARANIRHRRVEVSQEYVETRDGGYYVAGSRVSLDSIVYAFLGGQTAEAIGQAFPVLTLEQVYGALTFYLAHREVVDEHLAAQRSDIEAKRQAARDADPMFYQKVAAARRTAIAS